MKLFLDCNIVIDAVALRKPFDRVADKLMTLGRLGEFELWFGASQYPDVNYILRHSEGFTAEQAIEALRVIKAGTQTCSLTEADVDTAFGLGWSDFEDACIYSMADRVGVDYIITRNQKGFAGSLIKAVDCDGFFEALEQQGITYDWSAFA